MNKYVKDCKEEASPSSKLAGNVFLAMVTVEHLEKNLDKLTLKNAQKDELYKFLDRNEVPLESLNKTALAKELKVSRPTVLAWLREYTMKK